MFLLTAILLASSALSSSTQLVPPDTNTNSSDTLANVTMAFQKAHVVPDVIPNFDPVVGADVVFMDPTTTESVQVVPDILLTMERESFNLKYPKVLNNWVIDTDSCRDSEYATVPAHIKQYELVNVKRILGNHYR